MDEVHFQQHGSCCRMWVAPEVKDPVLLHHPTRKSVGYFGAVRLRDGKFVFAREQNCFDAATTWAFLRLLHQRSRQRQRRVVVITDNAKYHHATLHRDWRQQHERSFQLDYLPPYSPDPEPQSRCRPLCVNPRAVRIKGGPLSISSTYNSLTLCEDFVRIVLVGRKVMFKGPVSGPRCKAYLPRI